VCVDLARNQSIMTNKSSAQIQLALYLEVRLSLDLLGNEFTENHLLGKILRSDDNAVGMRTRRQKHAQAQDRNHLRQPFLDRSKPEVRNQREGGSGDRPGKNDAAIHHRYSTQNV